MGCVGVKCRQITQGKAGEICHPYLLILLLVDDVERERINDWWVGDVDDTCSSLN